MKLLLTIIGFLTLSYPYQVFGLGYEQQLTLLEEKLLSAPSESGYIIQSINENVSELSHAELTKFYTLVSIRSIFNGEYQDAIEQLWNAHEFATDDVEFVEIYHFLATAEVSMKNYSASLGYTNKVLGLIDDIDDVGLQIKAYNRAFSIFNLLGAHEDAMKYALQAYRLNKDVDDVNKCTSIFYIGLSYLNFDELPLAHKWFDESFEFCSLHNLKLMVAMSQKAKAETFIETEEFQLALEQLKLSEAGYRSFGYQLEIVSVDSMLAGVYLELGYVKFAREYANKVINIEDKPEYLEARKRAVRVLADINYILGNFKAAYKYQESYLVYAERLLNDTSAKSLAYQMAKFDSDEKDRQINMLEQERGSYVEQREADYQQQANATLILFLLSGGLVICFVGVLVSMKQRSRYKRMALMDGLTGVHNRATGMEKAENTYVQLMAKQSVMGVVVLDLDNFKQINDKHGHSSGDWALKKVVEAIKHKLRRMDIIVRLSGGDFVLFLPDMPATDAAALAESIRQSIMEIKPQLTEQSFILSASFGVSVSNDMDLSLDPVIKRAEIALRQAKESGKNQVAIYGKPTQTKSHPIE